MQKTYWAAWVGIAFANSLARSLSRLGQAIPIDADHALISSIALGGAVIRNGKNLVWFPEGRRTLTGDLLTFKPGIALLMQRFPVRAVPVYIDGTAKALAPGSSLPRPHRITVVFGKPVSLEELNGHSEGLAVQIRIASALQDRVQMLKEEFENRHAKQLA